jgi:lysophospholipase
MGAKKKSSSSEKQLKTTIKKLKTELERADAKASRWQKKAKQHKAALAASQKRVTKLEKRLAEARRTASEPGVTRDALAAPTEIVVAETSDAAGQPTSSTPDMSWTVVRLRAEARARGLTGLSSRPKAEILAALT